MTEHDPPFRVLLSVERLGPDRFAGVVLPGATGKAYGGHVAAQALHAAGLTVPSGRPPHSLHLYFVAAGAVDEPFEYVVQTVRDGGSFSVRQVTAQQGGTPRLVLMCSFTTEATSTEHQMTAPDSPDPETLPSVLDLVTEHARPVSQVLDLRPLSPRPGTTPLPANQLFWLRSRTPVPDEPLWNAVALTYLSDIGPSRVIERPHLGEPGRRSGASLDHAVWFHRPFSVNEWILVAQDSPTYAATRGIGQSRFFNRDGLLVASSVQEALLRRHP